MNNVVTLMSNLSLKEIGAIIILCENSALSASLCEIVGLRGAGCLHGGIINIEH